MQAVGDFRRTAGSLWGRLSAPSWVIPGTLADNCRFLADKVPEVGLLFFETEASLAYTGQDLPDPLARQSGACPAQVHVHLPLDLPWGAEAAGTPAGHARAGQRAAEICLRLMNKVDYLEAGRAVLHLPPFYAPGEAWRFKAGYQEQFAAFVRAWNGAGRPASSLLLENTLAGPLLPLAEVIEALGCTLCLDIGHALQALQGRSGVAECAADPASQKSWYFRNCRMVHASALDGKGRHAPLTVLHGAQYDLARKICRNAPPSAVFMLEVFNWPGLELSLPILQDWLF